MPSVLLKYFVASIVPLLTAVLYANDLIALATVKITLLLYFCFFVILPLIFKNCYSFQRSVVFLNFINVPHGAEYTNPVKYGLEGSRNFYLTTDDDVTLGVWQILPLNVQSRAGNVSDDSFFDNVLSDGQNVVIYNHGNGGCRLTPHRVETYKMLRQHFHVIAYDYRGYGDSSSGELSEENVVKDSIFIYKWVANKTKGHIFVWGHSLGTSVSTNALTRIMRSDVKKPVGLVLESPFNNMREEISEFPLARIFKHLPWFEYTIVDPMQENNFKFETDRYICHVDLPIMILHAVDDEVVPFKLGLKLYETAKECRTRNQGPITFHRFSGPVTYGHKYLYLASDIHDKIGNFVREVSTQAAQR